jgi:hypothetical protein
MLKGGIKTHSSHSGQSPLDPALIVIRKESQGMSAISPIEVPAKGVAGEGCFIVGGKSGESPIDVSNVQADPVVGTDIRCGGESFGR